MKVWIEKLKQQLPKRTRSTTAAVGESSDGFLDQLAGARAYCRFWRSLATLQMVCNVPLAGLTAYLGYEVVQSSQIAYIAMSPAIQEYDIVRVNQVSDRYIQGRFERAAMLNGTWNFQSVEDNYKTLFSDYYDHNLKVVTESNLLTSDRFNYVRQNRMVSKFTVDSKRSEYTWCQALNMACGIVVGKERVFIEGNQPYREEEVAYLMFGRAVYPKGKEEPFALRLTRLAIGKPETMKKALEGAKKGELPDEKA